MRSSLVVGPISHAHIVFCFFRTQTEPTVNPSSSQFRALEVIAEDDSGAIEGVELLESSDSSGTLVIFSFSSMQAVSDSIEIATTVNVNNFILKNQKKKGWIPNKKARSQF